MHEGQQYTVSTAGVWTPYYKRLIQALRNPPENASPERWLQIAAEGAAANAEHGPGDFASQAMAALNGAALTLGANHNAKGMILRGWKAGLQSPLPAPEGEDVGKQIITFVVQEILHYTNDRANRADRWYEVELVRATDGRIILRRGWITRYQGEDDAELFYVLADIASVRQHLGSRGPDLAMIEWAADAVTKGVKK